MEKDRLGVIQKPNRSSRDRKSRRRFVLIASVVVATVLAGLSLRETTESGTEAVSNGSKPTQVKPPAEEESKPKREPVSGEIEVGESFYDLMKNSGVEDADILKMSGASRKAFNLRKIRAGRAYEVRLDPDGIPSRFEYEIDDQRLLVLTRSSEEWSARIDPIEYRFRERVVKGVIKDSLYLSLVDACQSMALAIKLADIFAWDIDFALDLRPGDAYGILYQERWRGDRLVGPGRILAAEIVNQGETYSAIYYADGSGDGDYYDSDGRSLQKQFLKSPLRFKYISSYFSRSRLHPILKIRRPHLGVDYAAPYGTPVRASADGRVTFKGRNGGMGRMIKIRHNRIYATAYGHLSRYARGLTVGQSVRQGEIIGFVGSTGLSTGPHLHYSFFKYGKQMNPLRERNPRAKSIAPSALPAFKVMSRGFLERTRPSESDTVTAVVDRPGT